MRLKELRTLNALTQNELAKKAGVTQETVSRIENGHNEPMAKTIRKLAAALDVLPREVLGV